MVLVSRFGSHGVASWAVAYFPGFASGWGSLEGAPHPRTLQHRVRDCRLWSYTLGRVEQRARGVLAVFGLGAILITIVRSMREKEKE